MKQLVLLTVLSCVNVSAIIAQPLAFRWREKDGDKYIGLNMSTTRYNGDLSERYNIAHLQLGWAIEGHMRYRITEELCARADVGVYHIQADQRFTRAKDNYLSFGATNLSANLMAQWDFRPITYNQQNIIYVLAGVGLTSLSPTARLRGVTYSLPDFQTEGIKYARLAGQFCYGAGIPFSLGASTQLRIEGRYTHVLSDYVDDVSGQYVDKSVGPVLEQQLADRRIEQGLPANGIGTKRGSADDNDGYFLLTLQFIYKFD